MSTLPDVPETETPVVAETPEAKKDEAKRGRPSKAQEFANYIKALKVLTELAKLMGGFDNLRTLLDVLEDSSKTTA